MLEAHRRRLDPVQAGLIAAHVTLCREDEIARLDPQILRHRIASRQRCKDSRLYPGIVSCMGRRYIVTGRSAHGVGAHTNTWSVAPSISTPWKHGQALMEYVSDRPIDHRGTPQRRKLFTARAVRLICATFLYGAVFAFTPAAAQQVDSSELNPAPAQALDGIPEPPGRVELQPVAGDDEIRQRIADILTTTGWFGEPEVTVEQGIVFLKGTTDTDEYRQWAGNLARNTVGVVAVVNQIEMTPSRIWDFDPTFQVMDDLARRFVRLLPLIVVALVVIAISWFLARFTVRVLRRWLLDRSLTRLLREVLARAGGILVMLAGLYLVLRIAGLTQLALTVVGGTGLLGLVLGIAFRDITENFLASLFLSLQQPFREGDLVEVAGVTGYVQRLTSRTTVLMTLDGNQVQVPNSTIFKSTIRNFTSNPNRREDFVVGIGYDDSIPHAQEVALKVLAEHPAVLDEPEPLVLVENLGSSTVNLRVYFWLDGGQHSWLKVKSSVIRLVKRAFQEAGISLPDEARELIFPQGVPVHIIESAGSTEPAAPTRAKPPVEPKTVATSGEASLQSDAGEIKEQARKSWTPGENLLTPTSFPDPT
ncbi:MAG: mechanosensitive ion channel [Rhodothermales bacterium]|nr:mechanosensitive ion channel [Rhodothermales bacterium]